MNARKNKQSQFNLIQFDNVFTSNHFLVNLFGLSFYNFKFRPIFPIRCCRICSHCRIHCPKLCDSLLQDLFSLPNSLPEIVRFVVAGFVLIAKFIARNCACHPRKRWNHEHYCCLMQKDLEMIAKWLRQSV